MKMWSRVQRLSRWSRWPIKGLIVAMTLFLVSYPDPRIFVRHVQHWRNPNAMIDPDLPELQPWVAEVRVRIQPDMEPSKALRTVERFVYEKVPYAWDWDTWRVADYLPTLSETIRLGREDCDGRAVVAASLLASLGYKTELVTDFAHVWVKTDQGETMGARPTKAVEATPEGLKVNRVAYFNVIKYWAYGISVFPLVRELIVAVVLWAMFLHGKPDRYAVAGFLLLVGGLFLLRMVGDNPDEAKGWLQLLGYAQWAAALMILIHHGRQWQRRNRAPVPTS